MKTDDFKQQFLSENREHLKQTLFDMKLDNIKVWEVSDLVAGNSTIILNAISDIIKATDKAADKKMYNQVKCIITYCN